MVIAGLPLDGLVMLAAYDQSSWYEQNFETQHFWHRFSQNSPFSTLACGFIAMPLEDSGVRKKLLLPSLKQLVMSLYSLPLLPT